MKWGWAIGIFAILVVGVGVWFFTTRPEQNNQPQSSASITPTIVDPGETPTDITPSATKNLPTKYIFPVDWPPERRVENQTFECVEAGQESDRADQTTQVEIEGREYCVTKISEGAAGSIYTQYAYARSVGDQTEIFNFSLRFPQCGNYPEQAMTECEQERENFDVDVFVDEYIQQNY